MLGVSECYPEFRPPSGRRKSKKVAKGCRLVRRFYAAEVRVGWCARRKCYFNHPAFSAEPAKVIGAEGREQRNQMKPEPSVCFYAVLVVAGTGDNGTLACPDSRRG